MSARRALPVVAAAALSALAVSPAIASAPPGHYQTFNINDQTIHDTKTGLTWQRRVDASKLVDVSGAVAYCDQLNVGNPTSPWRVPTYKELLTLVDENPHAEYDPLAQKESDRFIDPNAFVGTPPGSFVSVSYVGSTSQVLVVDFSSGSVAALGDTGKYYVRCVR